MNIDILYDIYLKRIIFPTARVKRSDADGTTLK